MGGAGEFNPELKLTKGYRQQRTGTFSRYLLVEENLLATPDRLKLSPDADSCGPLMSLIDLFWSRLQRRAQIEGIFYDVATVLARDASEKAQ